jgi:hypothetical protein
MTLPAAGSEIAMSDVNTEFGLSSTTQSGVAGRAWSGNMNRMYIPTSTSQVGLSSNNSGYGTVNYNSISLNLGAITSLTSSSTVYDVYRSIDNGDMQSAQYISINLEYDITNINSGSWNYYYSVNSTSSWNNIGTGSGNVSAISYNISSPIDYSQVVRLRIYATHNAIDWITGSFGIGPNCRWYKGAGSISRVATYTWEWTQ